MFSSRLSSVHGVDALSPRLPSDGVDAVYPPLDTGLTLFPPTRHGVDSVSPRHGVDAVFPRHEVDAVSLKQFSVHGADALSPITFCA